MVLEQNLPSKQGERVDLLPETSGQHCPEVEKPSVAAPRAVGVSEGTYKKAKVIAAKAPEKVKELQLLRHVAQKLSRPAGSGGGGHGGMPTGR
jgi:hypothetical protein